MVLLISFFALLFGSSRAEMEEFLVTDKDQALYVLLYPAIENALSKPSVLSILLAYENELGRGASLVLQPSLAMASIQEEKVGGVSPPKSSFFAIGMGAALREYFDGVKSSGVYGSPSMGLMYASVKRPASSELESESTEMIGFAIGAQLGGRAKWEWFTSYAEVGLGYQWVVINGNAGVDGVLESGFNSTVALGVGVPF